ncbi:hypothetical protein FSARC_2737 [Fusarium sarcochroum]|uniref:Uncharacterized protein n=1 Tax=Fusarium sarcochroum TaxID=1208366 RepID=A0A8H4U5A7_9HYPO|nr:hypothetical protein FSARC_2737 [Fusarium sarcochroum]
MSGEPTFLTPAEGGRIWRDFTSTDETFRHFNEPAPDERPNYCFAITGEALRTVHTPQDWFLIVFTDRTVFKEPPSYRRIENERDWTSWKTDCAPAVIPGISKPSFSLLKNSHGDDGTNLKHYPQTLSWLPVSADKTKDIATSMYVPAAFFDLIRRPRTVFTKLESFVQGQKCEVYVFSVNPALGHSTAINVTYFPDTQQVFGVFMGYNDREDFEDITAHLFLNRRFVENPFALILAFLEFEKKHRFAQIDYLVDKLSDKIARYQRASQEADDQSETIHELYSRVGTLTTQLKMWKMQLDKLLPLCPRITPRREYTMERGGFWLRPEDYIAELQDVYEEGIMRCENSMQTVALAIQVNLVEVMHNKTSINDFECE